jgi:hypothetical protein
MIGELLAPDLARVPRTFSNDEDLLGVTFAMGLEGVIAKRLDVPYRPGRRDGTWIKLKHRRSERLAIIGWRERPGAPTSCSSPTSTGAPGDGAHSASPPTPDRASPGPRASTDASAEARGLRPRHSWSSTSRTTEDQTDDSATQS